MFIDRETELIALNAILARPQAQFLVAYGRRRVGKTTLSLEWIRRSGQPFIYWVAARESSTLLLRSFSQALYNHTHPDTPADPLFTYATWEMALREVAYLAQNGRFVLILDEFTYAVQSEPALPSLLQNAWDHLFKSTQLVLVLAGSQVGMMVDLLGYQAPLYGRITAQLALKPLPFRALAQFFPHYTTEERVAVYAILGGIPAYLEKFSDAYSLAHNIREQILAPTSVFQNEPFFLLQDEVREVTNYLAIIRAIGEGAHTLDAITLLAGLPKNHVSTYLARLQELTFVQRELPVTHPPDKATTRGRYILADAYLRFYFRFLAPNRLLLEQGLQNRLWELIRDGLRAFVGQTAFEEICRTWTMQQAATGRLPFLPDAVGRHWGREAEIDVVAINRHKRQLLLGECKWGVEDISQEVVRSLVEVRGPKVIAQLEGEWSVQYAFFARTGFTPSALAEAKSVGAVTINSNQLEQELIAG